MCIVKTKEWDRVALVDEACCPMYSVKGHDRDTGRVLSVQKFNSYLRGMAKSLRQRETVDYK